MNHAPLRVGVIGCGVVAQVMHLPNLTALPELFTIVALCDASPTVLRGCAERYRVPVTTTVWTDLLDHSLDAVLVLTPGSHAPLVTAFVEAGVAVFAEKPIAFSEAEGTDIIRAIERSGTPVMVGYMKRYDPAYERLREVPPRHRCHSTGADDDDGDCVPALSRASAGTCCRRSRGRRARTVRSR
jgi:predicted dehydrogenase